MNLGETGQMICVIIMAFLFGFLVGRGFDNTKVTFIIIMAYCLFATLETIFYIVNKRRERK